MKFPRLPPKLLNFEEVQGIFPTQEEFFSQLKAAGELPYYHWDDLRHRPRPAGFSESQWWSLIAIARTSWVNFFPLKDMRGKLFSFANTPRIQRACMKADQQLAGRMGLPNDALTPAARTAHVARAVVEEAITSSQLEGAATTKQRARELLASAREPKTLDERMIVGNYRAMEWVRQYVGKPLTEAALLELHNIVMNEPETLQQDQRKAGRYRRADEEIVVSDADGEVVHTPPAADTLPQRVRAMLSFANHDDTSDRAEDEFVHPVVRSLLLHFWLAYDHPFADGNGRTARAIFYWSMLHRGYWIAEFLSVSKAIKKARGQYDRAFLLAETGPSDATYFLLNQLDAMDAAMADLQASVKRQAASAAELNGTLRAAAFNERQRAALADALRDSTSRFTFNEHKQHHGVSYQTARNDLLELAQRGLFESYVEGKKTVVFVPARNLSERMRTLEKPPAAGPKQPRRTGKTKPRS